MPKKETNELRKSSVVAGLSHNQQTIGGREGAQGTLHDLWRANYMPNSYQAGGSASKVLKNDEWISPSRTFSVEKGKKKWGKREKKLTIYLLYESKGFDPQWRELRLSW